MAANLWSAAGRDVATKRLMGDYARLRTLATAVASAVTERAVEKHINSIFSKLELTEEEDVNRRVRAALVFLSDV